eukprot:498725_1
MVSSSRNMTLIILYTFFFCISHNASQVLSTYTVSCGNETITNGTINDTSSAVALDNINIPINQGSEPCYLHISLSASGNLSFQDAMECTTHFTFMHRTYTPTTEPTFDPTLEPIFYEPTQNTNAPTVHPSISPTVASSNPSSSPSTDPSASPSLTPTTSAPSSTPSSSPSESPIDVGVTISPSTETSVPTTSPSAYPTVPPSATPTLIPSGSPTAIPSISPSALPTSVPSVSPSVIPTGGPTQFTDSPTLATEAPTSYPTTNVSISPSISPTDAPTNSTNAPTPNTPAPTAYPTIPVDDFEFTHLFNLNDENVFWRQYFNNHTYHQLEFAPSCSVSGVSNNNTFGQWNVFSANTTYALWSMVQDVFNQSALDTIMTGNILGNTELLPYEFEVYTNEMNVSTLSVSVVNITTPSVTCYYSNGFNASKSGAIDYWLFPRDLGVTAGSMKNISVDITIATWCEERTTTTASPSSSPITAIPTISPTLLNVTNLTATIASTKTEEESGLMDKKWEFMIGIGVFAFIVIIASLLVCVRIKRKEPSLTDGDEVSEEPLKAPKVVKHKPEKNTVIVSEADHREMVELARLDDSLSVGLEED